VSVIAEARVEQPSADLGYTFQCPLLAVHRRRL